MPHYADRTEAKVGDQVIGQLKNTPGVVAGTVISITPGSDFCNAMVQFTIALFGHEAPPRMTIYEVEHDGRRVPRARAAFDENHGAGGATRILYECADYCDTKGLTKVGP